jgi:type IV pilus assembly protein PilC
MAKYQYSALDHKGEMKTGSVEAASEAEALEQIRGAGLYPTEIVEAGKGKLQNAPKKKKSKSQGNDGGKKR